MFNFKSSLWHLGVGAGLTLLLSACQPQVGRAHLGPDEKLLITKSVWANYQEFLRIRGSAAGVFVVTESGTGSTYVYCPEVQCMAGSYTQQAIKICEDAGVKCVVFAKGDDIIVPYEIVD